MSNDIGGVWRTIGGRRVFIKDGQDLATAMKESGKFSNKEKRNVETEKNDNFKDTKKYNKPSDFKTIDELDEEKCDYTNQNGYLKQIYKEKHDFILENMAKEKGYDKIPTLISKEEMNTLEKDGNLIMYRSLSSRDGHDAQYYVDEFTNGNYYAGLGNYGCGTYAGNDLNTIKQYINDDSKVMKMSMTKDAKIYKFKNTDELMHYIEDDLKTNNYNKKEAFVMEDPGRNLLVKGYDAYYLEDWKYYVILNRGKVLVEK